MPTNKELKDRLEKLTDDRNDVNDRILDRFLGHFNVLENNLYSLILQTAFDKVRVNDNGFISDTNIVTITNLVEKAFSSYRTRGEKVFKGSGLQITIDLVEAFEEITKFNNALYAFTGNATKKRIDKASEKAKSKVDKSLGIVRKNGRISIAKKSVLDDFVNGSTLKSEIISIFNRAIQGRGTRIDLRNELKELIKGKEKDDGTFTAGGLQKQLDSVILQRSRLEAEELGKAFGLDKYYFYNGTKRRDSRPFCVGGAETRGRGKDKRVIRRFKRKKGNVFTIKEINEWKRQKWQGKPKRGYNPFHAPGGINCVDQLDPISYEVAKAYRNDI